MNTTSTLDVYATDKVDAVDAALPPFEAGMVEAGIYPDPNVRNEGATADEQYLIELLSHGRGLAARIGQVVVTATGYRYECEDEADAQRMIDHIAAVGLPAGGPGMVHAMEWSTLQLEALEVMAGYADGGL